MSSKQARRAVGVFPVETPSLSSPRRAADRGWRLPAAAAVACAAVAGGLWSQPAWTGTAGAAPVVPRVTAAAGDPLATTAPPAPLAGPAGEVVAASPEPGQLPCAESPAPGQLVIPSLCVTGQLTPVGTTRDHVVQTPDDPTVLGVWDQAQPLEAPAGTTVIAGHVNTLSRGAGTFYRLASIQPGGVVVTATDDGHVTRWGVTSITEVQPEEVATSPALAQGPTRRLVLITCGGNPTRLRDGSWGYDRNVVVTAVPLS